mgnify:CR=1 FL=1
MAFLKGFFSRLFKYKSSQKVKAQENIQDNTKQDADNEDGIISNLKGKLCTPYGMLLYLPEGDFDQASIGTYHIIGDDIITFVDNHGNFYVEDPSGKNCVVVEKNSNKKDKKDYLCIVSNKDHSTNRAILFLYTETDESVQILSSDIYVSNLVKVLSFDYSTATFAVIMEDNAMIELEVNYIHNSNMNYGNKKKNFIIQYKKDTGIYMMPSRVYDMYNDFMTTFRENRLDQVNVI